MLLVVSALKGYAIEASDGRLGTVSDFLFDDVTWKVRWLVVDTGAWLTGHKVLVHPSAIGQMDNDRRRLPVALTKAQVEASPDILQDQPVSRQMEDHLYDYYGWDPRWGGSSYFGTNPGAIASPLSPPPYFGGAAVREAAGDDPRADDGDPHLRSIAVVTGYHIHASDGEIGHVENFLVDDARWDVRYLIIDTRNWWPGQHVLISPYAVQDISWPDHQIRLDVARDQVKASPPWDPLDKIDQAYERRLHDHYGWCGYGFQ
jgi:sporulation protein YlmC with PRC-barrel domain